MKKIVLCLSMLASALCLNGQTATNFTCNDCAGNSHDLFAELDSGQVIVLCWVMPCSACSAPAQSAYNTCQTYSVSNPGVVQFYLCDDLGTTSCATMNNWKTSNNLTNATVFSNSSISMTDYGSSGMPKIVILGGGTSHLVYDNQDNTLNSTQFSNALSNAVAASTGITQAAASSLSARVLPTLVGEELMMKFNGFAGENVKIEIFNAIGEKISAREQSAVGGVNEVRMNVAALANGNYFVKISNGKMEEALKFVIAH